MYSIRKQYQKYDLSFENVSYILMSSAIKKNVQGIKEREREREREQVKEVFYSSE